MSYSRRELYAFGEPLGESVTRKEFGRMIYGGGGGGGGGGSPAPPAPPPPPPRMASAAPPPTFQTYGSGDRTGSLVQAGGGMRPSALDYSKPIYDPNYADNITGYQQSSQFYQPIYQPQYNNYATTNRLGVSQYGTPMTPGSLVDSAYAGIGRFGAGTGTDQVDPGGRQFWNNALTSGTVSPQNFNQSFNNVVQDYQRQNPNDRYTQYTQNQPGYTGGFTGFSGGFTPQQASFNPYTNRSGFDGFGMGNLSNLLRQAMPQMQSPFSNQQPQQQMQQYNPYQMQSPFSYQQPFSGGYGGGNFIPDAPLPEGMMGTMGGTGFDPMTGRMDLGTAGGSGQYTPAPPRSSGPSQAIVGRSAQMRGTPNVMRRAEGGIASLVDDVE